MIDATASGDRSTPATTIATSAFSTTSPKELLLAFVSSDSVGTVQVNSVSGGGLTWVLVRRTNAQLGTADIWRAFAQNALTATTVTATLSQSVAASITVISFIGTDPSGSNGAGAIGATASGSAASGAPTASLVTTRNSSWVFGVGTDWDTATSRTLGSNQTMVHEFKPTVGDTYWVQRRTNPTASSGTSVTINDTAPTGDRYDLTICEILADTTPPTVSMTAPSNGATVSGTSVTVSATASDNATVVGVQFKLDGTNLNAEDTTSPYSITWNTTTTSNGGHTLTAVARDAFGNTTTSSGVSVTVNNGDVTPPTVSVTAPANNATVSGTTVSVTATASDNVGVVGVQFKLDGANLGAEDTTSPYAITWNSTTASNASHTLTAVARDAAGNATTSTVVNVTVDNVAPTMSVTAPANNATVSGTAVAVTATASDNVGVVGVQFKLDGANLAAEDTTAPYAITWNSTTASNASHTLTAVARDAAGNATTSTVVTVTVDNSAPAVSLTAPANNATVSGASVPVTATASDNAGVVGVQFKLDGANLANEDTTPPYAVTWDSTGATNGAHTLTAVARDAAGNTTTATAVTVSVDNAAPAVSVTAPSNNDIVSGVSVPVTATASDNVGVGGVQFLLDGANLGAEDTTSPFAVTWDLSGAVNGAHTLAAVARDAQGNATTSAVVNVTVDNAAPSVSLTAPANGATVSGASVSVTATASDSVGVVGVQFQLDGANLGAEDTTSPYAVTWNSTGATDGAHTLTAVARDGQGNATTSAAVNVTVDNAAPAVSLTAPANGATVSGASVSVTATASDNVGVVGVQFQLDGANLGAEDTTPPYAVTWDSTGATNGAHTLTAVARDAAGNTTTASTATVTVDNAAPSVSLTTPANGATVSGANVAVTATASDNVGVVGVQFKLDGANLGGEDTTAPYAVTWDSTGATNGAHTLTAVARDAAGNTTTASTATVTVDNDAPSVSLTTPANGATVSGASVSLTATASDNVGVVGVQFQLDGANLGAEDTTSPYAITWDSTGATGGTHSLRAVARDGGWNVTTSAAVTVTVDNVAPSVTGTTPVNSASGIDRSTAVTVTFSEPMAASSITTSSVELRNPANTIVPATVTYDAGLSRATLQPASPLAPGTAYTATVRGGATGPRVTDAAGNALAADVTWSFTTVGPSITSLSPTSGQVATFVTITGSNFGSAQGSSVVTLNGVSPLDAVVFFVISWSETSIVLELGPDAMSGPIVVTAGIASNAVPFTVVSIDGTISRANDGSGISGALVEVMSLGATLFSTTSGADGHYTFTGLEPNFYDLRVSKAGYITQTLPEAAVVGRGALYNNVALVSSGPVTYTYDALNRLTSVADSGEWARYNYDAVGNIVSIERGSSAAVTIFGFSPAAGPVGSTVSISGTGFSATAGQNSVSFSGSAASVSSATVTNLIVTVPAGATTGPIAVTSPNGSATSTASFVVASPTAPAIASFAPTIAMPGTTVVISGTNFDPIPAQNRVIVNSHLAIVTASTPSSLSITVPDATGSGRLIVSTIAGSVTSVDDLFIPPPSDSVADVVFTGRLTLGTEKTVTMTPANKVGLLTFDGQPGQTLNLQFIPDPITAASVSLYTPDNLELFSGSATASLNLPPLPISGTYTLRVGASTMVSAKFTLVSRTADVTGTIVPGGDPVQVDLNTPGQIARLSFNAAAGQKVSLKCSGSEIASAAVRILRPGGTTIVTQTFGLSGAFVNTQEMPVAGTYIVEVDPAGSNTGKVTLTLYNAIELTGSIVPGDPPFAVHTEIPGQNARLTFSGTSSQMATVQVTGNSMGSVTVTLLQPNGAVIVTSTSSALSFTLPTRALPVVGTYTVLVDPAGTNTGNISVAVVASAIVAPPPRPGGSALDPSNALVTSLAGLFLMNEASGAADLNLVDSQLATFAGADLPVWNSGDPSVLVNGGGSLNSYLTAGPALTFDRMPTSKITVVAKVYVSAVAAAGIAEKHDGDTINSGFVFGWDSGGALKLTVEKSIGNMRVATASGLVSSGRWLQLAFTWDGTAGAAAAAHLFVYGIEQAKATSDDGTGILGYAAATNQPFRIGNASFDFAGALNGRIAYLAVYRDRILSPTEMNQLDAALPITLNDTTVIVTPGTPATVTTSAAGQNAQLTFAATAGQHASIQLTNNTIGPVTVSLLRPDRTAITSVTSSAATISLPDQWLTSTGIYTIYVQPTGATSGSVTANVTLASYPARPVGSTVDPSNALSTSLVGLFLMNEGTGSSDQNVIDSQPALFAGTNLPTWNTTDPSVVFAGGAALNSYLNAGTSLAFDQLPTGRITVAAKVYVNAITAAGVAEKNDNNTINSGFVFGWDSTGALKLTVEKATTNMKVATASSAVPAGRWVQVAFTWDGTVGTAAAAHVFIDGVEQPKATSADGTGTLGYAAATNQPFRIGNASFDFAGALNGRIAYLAVYRDRILSPTEMNQLDAALPVTANDVTAVVTPGTPATVTTSAAGQKAQLTFAATASQHASIQLTNNTIGPVTVSLLRPERTEITSVTSSAATIALPDQWLTTTGFYTIYVQPTGATSGGVTANLTLTTLPARPAGSTIDAANALSTNLVGLFLMNEGTGTSDQNVVNGQSATFSGPSLPTWNTTDPSVVFAGGISQNSTLNAGTSLAFDQLPTSQVTLVAKVFVSTLAAAGVASKNDGDTINSGFVFGWDSGGALKLTVEKSSVDMRVSTASGVVSSGRWVQVAFTWDGTVGTAAAAHLFIDGVEQAKATSTDGSGVLGYANATNANFRIGNANFDFAGSLNGKMAYLAVYRARILTSGELAALDSQLPIH